MYLSVSLTTSDSLTTGSQSYYYLEANPIGIVDYNIKIINRMVLACSFSLNPRNTASNFQTSAV